MQRQVSLVVIGVAVVLAGAAAVTGAAGLALAQEETTPADNETTGGDATPIDQHDDPRDVSADGDVGQLSDWLSGHLSDRLEDGMVELSEGQYDQVEGLVDDEFESRLSQFVDVAGETNAESDDEAAETMETVAEDQQEFGEDVQEYRETYETYREARDAGDTTAAREHARDLEDLAVDIQDTGGTLRTGYERIGNATDRDLSEGIGAVDTVVTNVSTTQEEVRDVTFVETTLSVTANRSVAAFDRPASIEGQVVADNGSALANRSISIQVGARSGTVTTDGEGRFTTIYRPVWTRVDADSVPVTFRPRPDSAYLDSGTNLSLDVGAVEPSVSITGAPESVAFGEDVPVQATITVDGRPVPDVSGTVGIGGRQLARTNASADGALTVAPSLPADVPAGEGMIRVTAGEDGRAIATASTTGSIQVEETATELTLDTQEVDGDLVVTGTLASTDGDAVPERAVSLEAGATAETVRTNASGAYATALDGENIGDPGEEITVSTSFDGEGTNLEDATASTTVTVPGQTGESAGTESFLADVPWLVVGAGVAAIALLAGAIFLTIRWNRGGADTVTTDETETATDAAASRPDDADRWIDAAREALGRGDERSAIARAYAASYAGVQERLDVGEDRTPRELLAAAEGRVDDAVLDALAGVADAYERMAFAGSGPGEAQDVLEQARIVVERPRSGSATDDD